LPEATACPPAVVADTIMRTIELGVTITLAAVDEKQTTIFCTPVARDPRCPDCGRQGRYRDTVTRPLTDLPVAGYPLVLRVAVPRYRCDTVDCGRAVFNQDLGKLAYPRSSTTRRCARYVLRRLMIDRTTISAIAAELGVSWHTVSSIAMRATCVGVGVGAKPQQFGVIEMHPGVLGQLKSRVEAAACLVGLTGDDQQSPEDSVEESEVQVQPDLLLALLVDSQVSLRFLTDDCTELHLCMTTTTTTPRPHIRPPPRCVGSRL
jgi:hypothetical protein